MTTCRALLACLALLLLSTTPAGAEAPFTAIGSPELVPGSTQKIVVDEKAGPFKRSFRIHLPRGYDASRSYPLVIGLHGGLATARIFEEQSHLSAAADRHGFVAVYPNGMGVFSLFRHWNGGYCCARAMKMGLDDVGFLDRIRQWVSDQVSVDPEQHYLVGYSNGGMLAFLYAETQSRSDLSETSLPGLAGLGIWASSLPAFFSDGEPDSFQTPVPTLIAHGKDDPRLPWESLEERPEAEGRSQSLLGAVGSAAAWADANGCKEAAQANVADDTGIERRSWCPEDRQRRVTLVGLPSWGHDWPGPKFTERKKTPQNLRGYDLAEVLWQFFSE